MTDKTKELPAKIIAGHESVKAPMPVKNTPPTGTEPRKKGKGTGKKK